MAGELPTGNTPTGFPGIDINPDTGCVVDEVPVAIVPVKACQCYSDCNYDETDTFIELGQKLDPKTIPLIALNRDKTCKVAYWGQNEDTLLAADVVLVPAKYRLDPVVGEDGNGGYGPHGEELQGDAERIARLTHARYGHIAFKQAPSAGCRNIWCDLVYIEEVLCLGVYPVKRVYEFFDPECQCFSEGYTQEVSDLVTDPCLDRILPDDGYGGLPFGYPEAISFEYCALPLPEKSATGANQYFQFRRMTPSCFRPNQGYYVRVEITSLAGAATISWADVLPAGHTLISGKISDTLTFMAAGETIVREYIVATPAAGPAVIITGAAQIVGQPGTAINLASEPMSLDAACPSLCFTEFGSQNPSVFGRVYWAGGGRVDPTIPADVGLWVKVVAGQGSAGLSKREQLVVIDTNVPNAAPSHTFQIADVTGFAVGLPVWIFNRDFVDNPMRRIMGLDIEEEEAQADPNEEVTGLYGEVTSINPALNQVTVTFYQVPNQIVRFTVAARAAMMVAPRNSSGFYWEASPALANLTGRLAQIHEQVSAHATLRWNYRYWNSSLNPAPCALAASFVCDGDGQSQQYELHGDADKQIINPVDWIDLWFSPSREVPLKVNADVSEDVITVCDICVFDPCDVIQIVDSNCTGKEGNGPGYVGSVILTAPSIGGQNCLTYHAVEGTVQIDPPIPGDIPGCGQIDGFKTSRHARAFVKPDVCHYMVSPTTKCDPDGHPIGGPGFACVNFETGRITFDPSVVAKNPLVCFRGIQDVIQLNVQEQAIYFLRGIDKSGCKSPPSKPIRMLGGGTPVEGGSVLYLAELDFLQGSFSSGVMADVPTVPAYYDVVVPPGETWRMFLLGFTYRMDVNSNFGPRNFTVSQEGINPVVPPFDLPGCWDEMLLGSSDHVYVALLRGAAFCEKVELAGPATVRFRMRYGGGAGNNLVAPSRLLIMYQRMAP